MTKGEIVQQPRSKFIKVQCLDCENEQIIFGSVSTEVKCLKCDKVLAKPRGGKARLMPIARELEQFS
ncbi:MAG: 30S ribosomal protein S27e [Candidatus Lokiarchaeota archaeon]|nr:30S ribosomal protein S27e [Candidatus Lokiarchaeota archaeon]